MIDVLSEFILGLYQIFTLQTISMMVVGILSGVIVGMLPGLGGPATLAIMLPFIYSMTPVSAFAFLLGMTAVCGTTGDITSILFGIPGEATTAATIVDGHPMAKKGEAGRALGAALMSSLVGAIFGAFSLALAVPIVRPLVLSLGSPEFFMLAILGISLIASLSGENLMKGLIAGGLGLLLATVGFDPISGIQRYTFGQIFLWDGIGLVPVTIGIFAIPETIDLAVKGSSIAEKHIGKLGGVMEGVKDTFRHWWLVIRCSAIGTYTGIIPGMGGTVGQWVAYAHAVQSSPNKERFGKGAVEGVLGPGAANNSSSGGSLIPTIAFGVPGSIPTAILLGAFIIQGLVPGPDMLIPQKNGGHLNLTFSLVWIIVISNLITVGGFFLFLNHLAKITKIRGALIIPFILLLVYLGAFAEKNAFPDLFLVLVFGLLGWVMVQLEWPRPPLVLGLVLGPLAEQKLFISTSRYGLNLFMRPGVWVIIVMILIVLFYPQLQKVLNKRKRGQRQTEFFGDPQSIPSGMTQNELKSLRIGWKILFSVFILIMFSWALGKSVSWNLRAGLFPWAISLMVFPLLVIHFTKELRNYTKRGVIGSKQRIHILPEEIFSNRIASVLIWIIGFFILIWIVGFFIATPLFTFFYLRVSAREKWITAIILAVANWAFLYGLFGYALRIPFPDGQLLIWLGLI